MNESLQAFSRPRAADVITSCAGGSSVRSTV
jgi:hypothetical protein